MYKTKSFLKRKKIYISPQIALIEEEFDDELLAGSVYGSAEGTDTTQGGGDKDPDRAKPTNQASIVFDDDYEFQYEIPE